MHKCIYNDMCTTFQLELYSESVQRSVRVPLTCRIVQGLPYDFIIGLSTIRKYKLAKVFDYIFDDREIEDELEWRYGLASSSVSSKTASSKTTLASSAVSTRGNTCGNQQRHKRRLVSRFSSSQNLDTVLETETDSVLDHEAPTAGVTQSLCAVSSERGEPNAKCSNGTECKCSKQRLVSNRTRTSTERELAGDNAN